MTNRHERLKEVYEYLRYQCGIHTQSDVAKALKMTRPSFSAALNGNEKYLTKSLFMKLCAAFPNVFNLEYLLTGEGSLLLHPSEPAPAPTTLANDNLLELHAQMIRSVDDLRQQLREEISEVQSLRQSLDAEVKQVQSLRRQLADILTHAEHNSHSYNSPPSTYGMVADELQ